MYDAFSADYDRFVNWEGRLRFELPWIESQLQAVGGAGSRLLDAACGTGWHAITLAQRGYLSAGADLSAAMIERARGNAAKEGATVNFEAAGFGALAWRFGAGGFDAVLCLGNSLPHVLSAAELEHALSDFAACLRPGGLLLLQNRNFDALALSRARWMEPQSYRQGEAEWLFLRFYDYDPDGLITFNILTLQREGDGAWQQQVSSTRLRPLPQAELLEALERAGFETPACYGSLGGELFEAGKSGNLVVVARRVRSILNAPSL